MKHKTQIFANQTQILADLSMSISAIICVTSAFICVLKILPSLAEEQTVVEYTSFNLRDPFENLLLKEGEKSRILTEGEEKTTGEINLPQFSLQGVIWDAPIPQAIIDDRIVKIGDTVKEAEVLDIKKEGVTLLFKNKKFIIKSTKGGE